MIKIIEELEKEKVIRFAFSLAIDAEITRIDVVDSLKEITKHIRNISKSDTTIRIRIPDSFFVNYACRDIDYNIGSSVSIDCDDESFNNVCFFVCDDLYGSNDQCFFIGSSSWGKIIRINAEIVLPI